MTLLVRKMRWRDLDQAIDLIERRRIEYERYEPVFWKRAARSRQWTFLFYRWLFVRGRATLLMAERDNALQGMLMARPIKVPPVFAPGGPTLFIDDFCVAEDPLWPEVGGALLSEIRSLARGASRQIVVVGGAQDAAKTGFLRSTDLSLASTWWTAIT